MDKSYFRLTFLLFWVTLIVGGTCRLYLKLFVIDSVTGFYSHGLVLIPVQNIILGAAIILMVLLNRIKVTDNDYPLVGRDQGMGVLAVLCGAALLLYTLEHTGWLQLTSHSGTMLQGKPLLFLGVLGALSAVSFMLLGMRELLNLRRPPNGVIVLFPAVWQLIVIVVKYNSYTTLTTIPDNLLVVLFMVFASVFMIGNARTICNFSRKDGRNYTLPSGLITGMLGILLVVPNYMYMALYRTASPAQALGDMESIYILLLSFYAITSAVRLRRSIAFV